MRPRLEGLQDGIDWSSSRFGYDQCLEKLIEAVRAEERANNKDGERYRWLAKYVSQLLMVSEQETHDIVDAAMRGGK